MKHTILRAHTFFLKFKDVKIKSAAIRIFFSLVIVGSFLGVINDAYPELQLALEIFIGMLIFIIVNTAAKFIPIEEILTKTL